MDHSRGYPVGDGTFASSARGTAPQKELDLQLAMMANDAYESEKTGATGTQSERELKKAGWQRLRPAGDHFLDGSNKVVSIPDLAPKMLRNGKSGFDAAIYRNDQGQYVVAFRGTDQWFGPEGADINANSGQALGLTTEQYKQAITLAQSAVRAFGRGNVIFTGHSLGGGLASAAMLATGAPGVTFNAAGLSDNTLRSLDLGKTPNAIREELAGSGQIRRYNVEGDLLTGLQQGAMLAPDAVGHELRLAAPRGACCNPVELHGGKGDGQAYVEALRENTPYRAADKPLSLSALEHYMEANFNFLASAGSNAFEAGSNAGRVFAEKGQALDHIARNEMAQGRVLPGSLRAVGEAADGILDAGAGLVRQGGNFAGDAMCEGASLLGHALRGAGKATGQEASFNQAALRVETAGERANALIDGASHEAAVLADKAGDDAKRAASEAADDVKRTSDKLSQGVRWLGEKTVQGAVWMIEKTVQGAELATEKAIQGAVWTIEKTVQGAELATEKAIQGAVWTIEKTVQGAELATEKAIQGAVWTIEKTVQGAELATEKAIQGTVWMIEKTVQGAQWVAGKTAQGVQWLAAKARAVGDAISQSAQKARDAIAEAGQTIAGLFNR